MEKIWEFFEKFDEMVYVSDLETHELIYVNEHLRKAFGCDACDQHLGKKCYQVLQGRDTPCSFCTNGELREGDFVSWVHENPVLNKRFLVKDSVVNYQGRKYRIEIAIDADHDMGYKSPFYYARSETILNGCLQEIFSSTNPEESIQHILTYIGQTFCCDRAYIFELENRKGADNTYEWCADNVSIQKDLLQNLSLSSIDWWLEQFKNNEVVVIRDLEDIRVQHPESYAILKPQEITSLAAGPIKADGEIVGFLGVDNPVPQMLGLLTPLLNVIGYFVSTLLKRRDMLAKLNKLSYHDQLTGALNRHALAEFYGTLPMEKVGVIYCDITGLKRVNDSMGHEAGDQVICRCYERIQGAVDSDMIYRTGGDEFIALCPNWEKDRFMESVRRLQEQVQQDEQHIAVGYVWADKQPLDLEKLITQADQVMYQDKRSYYQGNSRRPGVERRRSVCDREDESKSGTPLQNFLRSSTYDVESLFQAVSQDNESSYFYLGDMQQDIFYVSDNMRDDFGFQGNLVPGLLKLWAKRITTPEFQDLYWQDISKMLREKRTYHNLSYQVRDVNGNIQWIRCFGILKWNEDKTVPLFFSGRVTHQDKSFVIDPVSNFLREHAAFRQLAEIRQQGQKTFIIGFSLNGITEINSTKGRAYADRLLKKVADTLMDRLSWKMSFYRLDGMRCMAVVTPICCKEGPQALVEQIREAIKTCYESMGISVQNACSFGLMDYPCQDFTEEDLIENLISLIRVAKQDGVQTYVDYSIQNVQRIREMSNLVMALSQDVAHDMENFRIVIQPVVAAGTGKMIGGEVLMRWKYEGKDVSPGVFIPLLERGNLIQTVGRWVFEQAVCTCVRIHAYDPTLYLTFNVSLHQLSDPLLIPFMKETLEKYRLRGSSLVAELTESCLDEQPERLAHFVDECQNMGLRIALDDFGSGYSSMRMLLQYPSSIIKLDHSLVREVTESDAKMSFIRSIVFACHQFGKAVCMEGVEREEQNEIILNTGCDMIQGFYYYRPMELSDIYQLISQNKEKEEPSEGTETTTEE